MVFMVRRSLKYFESSVVAPLIPETTVLIVIGFLCIFVGKVNELVLCLYRVRW